jgi:hypothetical protein
MEHLCQSWCTPFKTFEMDEIQKLKAWISAELSLTLDSNLAVVHDGQMTRFLRICIDVWKIPTHSDWIVQMLA